MIPCYIGGKGMFATEATWSFKTTLFKCLRETRLGLDTRHQYYRPLFPRMPDAEFDRMVCDPIEYYDPEWTQWQQIHNDKSEDHCLTRFWLERDLMFQARASIGLFGLNEAGFGTAVNVARFLENHKPVFGFYCKADYDAEGVTGEHHPANQNFHNILQLEFTHPQLFNLISYSSQDELIQQVIELLMQQRRQ